MQNLKLEKTITELNNEKHVLESEKNFNSNENVSVIGIDLIITKLIYMLLVKQLLIH